MLFPLRGSSSETSQGYPGLHRRDQGHPVQLFQGRRKRRKELKKRTLSSSTAMKIDEEQKCTIETAIGNNSEKSGLIVKK